LIAKSFAGTFIPYHISALEPEHCKGEVIAFDLEKVLPVVLWATNLHVRLQKSDTLKRLS
jgi:hypothetical protein